MTVADPFSKPPDDPHHVPTIKTIDACLAGCKPDHRLPTPLTVTALSEAMAVPRLVGSGSYDPDRAVVKVWYRGLLLVVTDAHVLMRPTKQGESSMILEAR